MARDGKQEGHSYEALKERLRNQPRVRQFLERLELHGAPHSMLEAVARMFADGQHGEAEIQVVTYCELLRNRDTKAILKRVTGLRSSFVEIQLNLFRITSEIYQLKVWESYKNFGYDQWSEFAREVLGLSDKVVDALLIAREEASGLNLDGFLQTMIKGYAFPSLSEERPLSLQECGPYRREPEAIILELRECLEVAELRAGEEIRIRKRLEEELEKARTEMYRKIQEKQALIDKLTRCR